MTRETLDQHFGILCDDIRRGDASDALSLVTEDEIELGHLAEVEPTTASHYRPVVEDEEFLLEAAKSCAGGWYHYPVAA
jgi:hypothetical protein